MAVLTTEFVLAAFVEVAVGDEAGAAEAVEEARNLRLRSRVDNEAFVLLLFGVVTGDDELVVELLTD